MFHIILLVNKEDIHKTCLHIADESRGNFGLLSSTAIFDIYLKINIIRQI